MDMWQVRGRGKGAGLRGGGGAQGCGKGGGRVTFGIPLVKPVEFQQGAHESHEDLGLLPSGHQSFQVEGLADLYQAWVADQDDDKESWEAWASEEEEGTRCFV